MDVHVQGPDRGLRWLVPPERLDQLVSGGKATTAKQQARQKRALLRLAQGERRPVAYRLEGSEELELHLPKSLSSRS